MATRAPGPTPANGRRATWRTRTSATRPTTSTRPVVPAKNPPARKERNRSASAGPAAAAKPATSAVARAEPANPRPPDPFGAVIARSAGGARRPLGTYHLLIG